MIFISTIWWLSWLFFGFFMLTNSYMLIPEVTDCIQVDSELHDIHFYKRCFVALSQWFCQGQDYRLLSKSMLENSPLYLESCIEKMFFYIWRITELYVHKEACLLNRDPETCVAIAIHIHSAIPNTTTTFSVTVNFIIVWDQQWHDRCCQMCTDPDRWG